MVVKIHTEYLKDVNRLWIIYNYYDCIKTNQFLEIFKKILQIHRDFLENMILPSRILKVFKSCFK